MGAIVHEAATARARLKELLLELPEGVPLPEALGRNHAIDVLDVLAVDGTVAVAPDASKDLRNGFGRLPGLRNVTVLDGLKLLLGDSIVQLVCPFRVCDGVHAPPQANEQADEFRVVEEPARKLDDGLLSIHLVAVVGVQAEPFKGFLVVEQQEVEGAGRLRNVQDEGSFILGQEPAHLLVQGDGGVDCLALVHITQVGRAVLPEEAISGLVSEAFTATVVSLVFTDGAVIFDDAKGGVPPRLQGLDNCQTLLFLRG